MYSNFAYIYDKLMYDIDYKKWADYIEDIFKKNQVRPSMILDLGCGTGNFCIEMSKRGYEMIGLDLSVDMLNCAKEKSLKEGADILYLNQNMTNFELYGTVDVIVCLMDSMNYITNKKEMNRLFKLVANYLNPDGLFIFDVNTQYKLSEVLADNVFYDVSEQLSYIWQNRYDEKRKICEFDLTFFIKNGCNYERHDEVHYERVYSNEELKNLIEKAQLKLNHTFNALEFTSPSKESERIFYICKKMHNLL